MKNLTITYLKEIAKGTATVLVSVSGKGRFPVTPTYAKALLATEPTKDHDAFKTPRGFISTAVALTGERDYRHGIYAMKVED